ncbi:hypothetical protein OGAPHI_003403 [Ogataea philodendri]|uniref:Uncharacterized protein n=1 Tax=Ogataea philodendri TaxID=1378263 RepID=A0A9P8P6Z5_9ASCO|nr:uncharacterized protein OGAPHI_003403 [Ogataea philodendri]KAH3666953.1 hypothetical protein OGAPHI_003403 [Ogataea philodendri]
MFTLREQSFKPPDEITQRARQAVLDNIGKPRSKNESIIDRVRHRSALFAKRRPQLAPLSRTVSYDSNRSVFSTPSSLHTTATSIQSEPLRVPNSDFKDLVSEPDTLALGLGAVLDQVTACADVGNRVFNELSAVLRDTQKRAGASSPEKLIDWNLNLLRVLLFVREASLPHHWRGKQVFVQLETGELTDHGALVSEVTKIRRLQNPQYNKFLFHVASPSLQDKSPLRVTALGDTPQQILQTLVESDLFREFNIDTQFKHLVAKVSIENSLPLGPDFVAVALRNYFLNLLVASQTLFEFYYTHKVGVDVDNMSSRERRILWNSIRQRNFDKVRVFDDNLPTSRIA